MSKPEGSKSPMHKTSVTPLFLALSRAFLYMDKLAKPSFQIGEVASKHEKHDDSQKKASVILRTSEYAVSLRISILCRAREGSVTETVVFGSPERDYSE